MDMDIDTNMKVLKVLSTNGTRKGRVFSIEAQSKDTIRLSTIVSLNFKTIPYYFEVVEISTSDYDSLTFTAQETGYYNLFSKKPNFDLRALLDSPLEIVEDNETIQKLNKERMYC